VFLATACALLDPAPPALRASPTAAVAEFAFDVDTFAFPNEVRARTPDRPDLYANYCFVLARGLRQFFLFARFDPTGPRLSRDEYVERVRAVAARPPWHPAPPRAERVVIPGYANLREFSRGEEAAVKEGLGGRFWTLVHWTNWRVTFPVTRDHQAAVARETVEELAAGRLVQLLVTNWPKPELNHTIVVYAARPGPRGVDFVVWDPNEPEASGVLTFDSGAGRFWASRLFATEPGVIRAFRMYYSWLL
jgi:hypothetical protein